MTKKTNKVKKNNKVENASKNEAEAILEEILQSDKTEAIDGTAVEVTEEAEISTDDVLAEIQVEEMKVENYDNQGDGTPAKSGAKGTPAKTKVSKPRVTFASKREAIEAIGEDTLKEILGSSVDVVLTNVDGMAKKVGEKAVNALQAAAGTKKPSRYTVIALQAFLKAKEITSKGLYQAMIDAKCAESTARAQSQQMMALFPGIDLAKRSGSQLTLNEDFANLPAFEALAA